MKSDVTDYTGYISVRLYPEENKEVIIHFELDTIIVAITVQNGNYYFCEGKVFEIIEPELCKEARKVLNNRYIQLELRG